MVRLLNDLFGIQARGGCACAGPYGHALLNIDEEHSERYFQCILGDLEGIKPGWTRLNLAPWATDEEVSFLLSAVEFIAEYGERFLPLYDFNWQTGAWTHASDEAPLDLFGEGRPLSETGEVPYQTYLAEARHLASGLRERESPAPFRRRSPPTSCSSHIDTVLPPPMSPHGGRRGSAPDTPYRRVSWAWLRMPNER
ncbi:hypothetical protein ACFSC4_12700 [Deinococcus malanensis]|uniref:hypothetical protein n=1 Tax=Deinococcus malanensis TaxID=1706855 RepID=UPI0036440A68